MSLGLACAACPYQLVLVGNAHQKMLRGGAMAATVAFDTYRMTRRAAIRPVRVPGDTGRSDARRPRLPRSG